MKILLTGGSGFIGRNILESNLAQNYAIMAPRHSELDLTDTQAVSRFLSEHHFDVIIHAAVKPGHRSAPDPHQLLATNTRMFFNLAKQHAHFGKLLNLGSGAIYDGNHYQPRMSEDYHDWIPADDHGLCKYLCYQHIQHSPKLIDLRLFGVFGPYEDYSIRFISNLICKAVFNLPLRMIQNRRMDYLYVNDLMPILDYFINHDSNFRAVNITPDFTFELEKIAGLIQGIAGKDLPVILEKPGIGPEYSGDNTRLHSCIPSLTFTPLETAIRQLYDWYDHHKALINPDVLRITK